MKKQPAKPKTSSRLKHGIENGYRSGLEDRIARDLDSRGVPYRFEPADGKVPYIDTRPHRYLPDFVLPSGIIIETKGRFLSSDRAKHLLIKAQHPELDIRFVFSNSRARISKTSSTTYADWCHKNGYQFADKVVPEEWIT